MNSKSQLIQDLINSESHRQLTTLNLIASENYTSTAVRAAVGSPLMHKYSEGNIGKRYYEGNQFIDEIEQICIDLAAKLFKLPSDWGVNVQALSGSNANLAAYLACLNPGDTILGLHLPDGGHLSHGWSYTPQIVKENNQLSADSNNNSNSMFYPGGENKVNISAKLFNAIQYKVDPDTKLLNYDAISRIAQAHKPRMIITGGTAYPRNIDYVKIREIADSVGALYLADIAHEAGLVGAGVLPSPVGIADVVTMTTHKTLRAARGAIILAHQDIIKKVNRAILPGLQGGPFNNNIAGIAIGLEEALQPEFTTYAQTVILNAQALAKELTEKDFDLLTGGTDKHLILIDLTNKGISGKLAAKTLANVGIIVNMNTVPGEQRTPADPSGVRIGTPFVTSLGLKIEHMKTIAELISLTISATRNLTSDLQSEILAGKYNSPEFEEIKSQVQALTKQLKPRN